MPSIYPAFRLDCCVPIFSSVVSLPILDCLERNHVQIDALLVHPLFILPQPGGLLDRRCHVITHACLKCFILALPFQMPNTFLGSPCSLGSCCFCSPVFCIPCCLALCIPGGLTQGEERLRFFCFWFCFCFLVGLTTLGVWPCSNEYMSNTNWTWYLFFSSFL